MPRRIRALSAPVTLPQGTFATYISAVQRPANLEIRFVEKAVDSVSWRHAPTEMHPERVDSPHSPRPAVGRELGA